MCASVDNYPHHPDVYLSDSILHYNRLYHVLFVHMNASLIFPFSYYFGNVNARSGWEWLY